MGSRPSCRVIAHAVIARAVELGATLERPRIFHAGPQSGMLILGVTGSLLAFGQFFIRTGGGPDNSTMSIVMLIYRTTFFGFNLVGAAALSVVLLVALNALEPRVPRKDHTT